MVPVVAQTRRGLLLMLLATAAFVGMSVCVKSLREAGMSTAEVIFFRMTPGLVWLWFELRVHRKLELRPHRRDLVYLRSLFGIGAMATNFYAVQTLTLVQHNVLSLLQPVFIALLAPLLLRERMHAVVLAALVLAGGGALLVLDPGAAPAGLGAVPLVPACLGVASALFSAFAHMTIRRTAAHESPELVVFYFALHASLFGLVWSAASGGLGHLFDLVSSATLAALVGLALFGVLGQIAMTRAYGHAPATLVAIVAYVGIPFSLLADILLWDAHAGVSALVGALLMVAAGLLLSRWPRPLVAVQPGQP
ncbi:DMT family transporter [Nannocystis sp.]|uniref:DMT family transporter n=1 Tax=Nannocystis sp. TaxID=1962667 RepID=UPI0024268518|nr:DMT family transporter [Nannocystis sp.]MBK7824480.1 DMT family transporter [Nannocystis sp.]MBK9753270.1 DMT family transporter [Nannocystis sp.]